jgi:hypothetical protein
MLKVMKQHTKSLNSKTQIELLCLVFANRLFTFKGYNLLISSSISTFFIPLDAPSENLQNILKLKSNIARYKKL